MLSVFASAVCLEMLACLKHYTAVDCPLDEPDHLHPPRVHRVGLQDDHCVAVAVLFIGGCKARSCSLGDASLGSIEAVDVK